MTTTDIETSARIAELLAALDRFQHAATVAEARAAAAEAENERLRDEAGAARQDIDGFVEEIRDLNDQLAAETARADGAERAHDRLVRGLGLDEPVWVDPGPIEPDAPWVDPEVGDVGGGAG
jgi:predicted  nucleic acid-binding Zn-ribbon protein